MADYEKSGTKKASPREDWHLLRKGCFALLTCSREHLPSILALNDVDTAGLHVGATLSGDRVHPVGCRRLCALDILNGRQRTSIGEDGDGGALFLYLIPIGILERDSAHVERGDIGGQLVLQQGKIVVVNTEPVTIGILAVTTHE